MNKIKKLIYILLGCLFIGIGYIGIFVPGLPTTFFAIVASWFFMRSSDRLTKWVNEHPVLGRHVSNWTEKRIYPTYGRYAMVGFMILSLIIASQVMPLLPTIYMAIFFLAVVVWAFRYPGSEQEYEQRVREGEKIGWIK